jgi:hypothetical protein
LAAKAKQLGRETLRQLRKLEGHSSDVNCASFTRTENKGVTGAVPG